MKAIRKVLLSTAALLFMGGWACSQNGPTAPSVQLSWTQSASSGVTANCVYRGSAAGVYTLPAMYCSTSPITTWADTSVVRGATYHYAVTAKAGATESAYSNDAVAAVPVAPDAPVINPPAETKLQRPAATSELRLTAKVVFKR